MTKKSLERRSFLKLMGTGIGAAMFPIPLQTMAMGSQTSFSLLNFRLGMPEWIMHEDGTFDLLAGNVRLRKCRPTINGQSILARNFYDGDSPKGKRIIYNLDTGYIFLDFQIHSDSISIAAELSGVKVAPHSFSPIGEGRIEGAEYFFKQGLGTGGRSGVFRFPHSSSQNWGNTIGEQAWSYDSYLTSAITAPNGDTMAIGAFDHSNYLQRNTLYNRTHRRGLTDKDAGIDNHFFESGFLTENIPLAENLLKLPELYVYFGNQQSETLQHLAWNISQDNDARRDTNTSYHWCSRYEMHKEFSFDMLMEQLETLDEIEPRLPLQTVQIDDCYCIHGDWLNENDNWPKGMEEAARQIFQRRYRAGIWIAPFKVDERSKLFRHHKDWLHKDRNGNLIVEKDEPEGKQYSLDGSHPSVQRYLRKVFRSFRKMGFTFFKIDYMDWGFKHPENVKRAMPGKTSVQVYREIVSLIREEIGAGSFMLANRVPFGPMIGFVDAVRVANDADNKWTNSGTKNMLQESYYCQYMNNVFWQNDPDVVYLRDSKIKFSKTEQQSLVLWNGILGGSVCTSDKFVGWTKDQLRQWRFLQPQKRPQSAILPYWPNKRICKVAIRRYTDYKAWGLLVFNDTDQQVTESYSIDTLTGNRASWVYLWSSKGSMSLGKLKDINLTLNAHESRLMFLSDNHKDPLPEMSLSGVEMSSENYFDI